MFGIMSLKLPQCAHINVCNVCIYIDKKKVVFLIFRWNFWRIEAEKSSPSPALWLNFGVLMLFSKFNFIFFAADDKKKISY